MPDLVVESVTVKRGELAVVRGVSLSVPAGKVTVLLGSNGAGKSTLLDGISGVIPIASGKVTLDGEPIHELRRDRRAARGLAYVEQGRTIFSNLTVLENLAVAVKRGQSYDDAFVLFPELKDRRGIRAQMLSGGEQQMLVLARAIVSEPKVLLIDEMSQGLAPVIVKRLLPIVTAAADRGMAVLLVEQFAHLALGIGDRASILSVGTVVLEGSCSDLLERPDDVRHAYLQGESTAAGIEQLETRAAAQ